MEVCVLPARAGLAYRQVEIVTQDGTQIVVEEQPGPAVRVRVVAADGGRIADLTIRQGPPGDSNV